MVVCLVGWLISTEETQKRNKSNHFRETFSKDYYSNIALRIDSVITDLFGVAACVFGEPNLQQLPTIYLLQYKITKHKNQKIHTKYSKHKVVSVVV